MNVKKLLAVGIILLFIGIAVAPSITAYNSSLVNTIYVDDDNTGGSSRGLDKSGEESPGENAQTQGLHARHDVHKGGIGPERDHGIPHDSHPEKHQAQTQDREALLLRSFLPPHEKDCESESNQEKGVCGHVEGDDLSREGRPNVRPHDDPDGLGHGHEVGGDEPDDQDSGDRGRLNHRCE